jgi:hypothetical protein
MYWAFVPYECALEPHVGMWRNKDFNIGDSELEV